MELRPREQALSSRQEKLLKLAEVVQQLDTFTIDILLWYAQTQLPQETQEAGNGSDMPNTSSG